MNRKLIAAWCAACCLSIFNVIKAQELVTNAGGYATNGDASLGWSIGQIVTETSSVSGYILTQGFHQSSITVTSIEKPVSIFSQIQVYPNPTTSHLIISSEDPIHKQDKYTVLMYDMHGSIVFRSTSSLDIMTIDMKDFAPSVYLLKVVDSDNQDTRTFHIVKH